MSLGGQRLVVQKYGGSSVADITRIRAVAARVARTYGEGSAVVVVVSAMGNTTNELLALARQVSPTPGRRELDMLISVGERITMTLLAMALGDLGVPARSFTGSQSGIVTDGEHANARVIEVRPERVRAAVDAGEVAIVAGFQGVSRSREITTLGRGGSDTTAVVLAAALGAEVCEICSDVDGVWSADPRAVPAAKKLAELSTGEALALAENGAKVLYTEAVAWAREHGVIIHALQPSVGTGTRVVPGVPAPRVLAITSDTQLAFCPIGRLDALPASCIRSAGPAGAIIDRRNLHSPLDLDDAATVTVVGSRAGADPTTLARVLAASPGFAWHATPDAITFHCTPAEAPALEAALHGALCA